MAVESIIRKIIDKGLSGSFNRNVFKVLHKSLKDATNKGLIPRNPAEKAAKPKLNQKVMAPWNPDEATSFLNEISFHRLSIIFFLAIHTGMRQSEILGLRMSDIDLDNKTLHIRNILNYKKELQSGTKTASGTRSISFSFDVLGQIKKRINLISLEKQAAGDNYNDLGFLVCTKSGQPLPKHHCHELWSRLLVKTGMRKIRFHDLRHTCASLLVFIGEHPKVIQERLGHSSFKITMDLYSHLMPNMQLQASEALEKLLK